MSITVYYKAKIATASAEYIVLPMNLQTVVVTWRQLVYTREFSRSKSTSAYLLEVVMALSPHQHYLF